MRRMGLAIAIAVAGLVYVAIAFAFTIFGPVIEHPNNYTPSNKYDPYYRIVAAFFWRPVNVGGGWIVHHPELITALATVFIGWFTYALVLATKELTRIADQAESSSRTIERAYVTIVDVRPGVTLSNNGYTIIAKIQNFGRTPAVVSATPISPVLLNAGERLPAQPPYHGPGAPEPDVHGFLVSGHYFTVTTLSTDDDPIKLTAEVVEALQKGTKILHFVGYVDYIDKFGVRHRSGYGRTYTPIAAAGQLNLVFITQRGYNYDRERNKGEGNDWGNDAPL